MSGSETSEQTSGPNIVLTPDERRVFGQLFQAADSESIGVVTGEQAVKFFEKSGLNPRILAEIWGIADTENRGLLTKLGFSVALRLIGQAQNGQHPRPELALKPGPLPRFEGLNINYPQPQAPPTTSTPPPNTIAPQHAPAGPAMIRVPQLSEADCKKFTDLFQVSGAANGLLPGEAARGIFQRSKLPNQTLGLIWNLVDREQKGALVCNEFVVAMHLINCWKNGSLQALPPMLPPALFEAAAGRSPLKAGPDRRSAGRGTSPVPAVPPIPKQFSGPGSVRANSPLSRQYTPPNPIAAQVSAQTTGEWAITPREKADFDSIFATVDKGLKGYITGEEAVPFFSNSKLPEDVLAQIWDLADINKAGRLTQDEFAIAMYLIRQQRSRRDGKGLPDTLPPNLIPPSMRQQVGVNNVIQAPQGIASPPEQPPQAPQATSSAINELFGLDAFTSSPPSTSDGQTTAPAFNAFESNDVFGVHQKPSSPTLASRASPPQLTSMFTPPQNRFIPQSNFGQSLMAASTTGGSTVSTSRPQPSPIDDLLGDADPEVSRKLTADTTELANLSNQIGQLTTQTQELKNKRASAEQEFNSLNTQKQDIELRLSQIRALYEKEAKDVKAVEDQLALSKAETARLREEYSILEANYNQLLAQRQEIASQLETDQRENLELKERMRQINVENAQLKEQLEKLRSQARQHKGFVAISRKQLATSEAERDRLRAEAEEARSAVAPTQVASPNPGSPTLSQSSISTNPFHRRSPTVPESSFSQSPFSPNVPAPSQASYEDVFGPSFGGTNAASVPAPPIAFGKQSEMGMQSGPSVLSGTEGTVGHSTPPTSPPTSSYHNSPQNSDAPPPAPASQITSAFLPLSVNRADSVTSSIQVNPPTSTHDGGLSRPDTPTSNPMVQAVDSPARERDPFQRSEERRNSMSMRSDTGTEASGRIGLASLRTEDNRSPFAPVTLERNTTGTTSGGDEFKKSGEKRDSFSGFSVGSAAFQPIKPTATGESTRSRASNISKPEVTFAASLRPDPFGLNKDEHKAASASKEDMDAAFGSFGIPKLHQERQNTGGSSNRINIEFPPIEEIKQDDESDDSDDGPGGFEDNFTMGSPAQKRSALPGSVPPTTSAPPSTETESKQETSLSSINSNFPQEFRGLLSSRSDPMSHDAPTLSGNTNAILHSSISPSSSPPPQPNPLGLPTSKPLQSVMFSPSAGSAKAGPAMDEFDEDAFADLTDAKEVDGRGEHDDFGVLAHNDFDDFNPTFDSPSSKPNTSTTIVTSKGSALVDDDGFADFDFNIEAPTQHQQHTGQSSASAPLHIASSQDWDAIFANLADPSAGSKQNATNDGKGPATSNALAPSTDIGGPASVDLASLHNEKAH